MSRRAAILVVLLVLAVALTRTIFHLVLLIDL
jgi:hypothetical protein